MADKLLADVNICLDLLLDRHPFVKTSGKIFELAEKNFIQLYVSGLSFDTLFYIMRPSMKVDKATKLLRQFSTHVQIGMVNETVVNRALAAGWNDLEDALQYFCAVESECNWLITRNESDFKKAGETLLIASPEKYLSSINK